MVKSEIIAHSVNGYGKSIITFLLLYPRFIHAQVMTHRVFSRNAGSSRAIPTDKLIEFIKNNPTCPEIFKANKAGMQPGEDLSPTLIAQAKEVWLAHQEHSLQAAAHLSDLGVHKQWANRVLETHSHIQVLITATDWDNFFTLRCAEDAQDEITELANQMLHLKTNSEPEYLKENDWHLPFVSDRDKDLFLPKTLLQLSAARCARISYLTTNSFIDTCDVDLIRAERLLRNRHMSPFEHQAKAATLKAERQGNFSGGWIQHRQIL